MMLAYEAGVVVPRSRSAGRLPQIVQAYCPAAAPDVAG